MDDITFVDNDPAVKLEPIEAMEYETNDMCKQDSLHEETELVNVVKSETIESMSSGKCESTNNTTLRSQLLFEENAFGDIKNELLDEINKLNDYIDETENIDCDTQKTNHEKHSDLLVDNKEEDLTKGLVNDGAIEKPLNAPKRRRDLDPQPEIQAERSLSPPSPPGLSYLSSMLNPGSLLNRPAIRCYKKSAVTPTPKTNENIGHAESDSITEISNSPLNTRITKTYARKRPSTSTAEPLTDPVPIEVNLLQPELSQQKESLENVQLNMDPLSGISGYRIVDLKHVIQWAFLLERHRIMCESQIVFVSENRIGFHSEITFQCTMCEEIWKYKTEEDNKINTSFVWATMTAGSDYTQAAHITNLMDIPTMKAKKFRSIENKLCKVWHKHLTKEIKIAGEQERSIAIEKGHYSPDGVPYIAVYADGGWLKRSYGQNFDFKSGVACIIGKETKKCLYLGVRNKYCYTCQYYVEQNMDVKTHYCCTNVTGSSTAMESEIIIDGFRNSEEQHGLRYLNLIDDGNSSVYSKLKEKVPYGSQIKKMECENRVIKKYTIALYKILINTKLPLDGRNILKPNLMKLSLVARKIITHNCKQPSLMAEDLRNGPLHVFGNHEKCKKYFCKLKRTPTNELQEEEENLVDNLEKSAPEVWALICAANERIALKAGCLTNDTHEIFYYVGYMVENLMSIINKFSRGKRLSLGKGGSYQRRVRVAGLSQIAGRKWHVPSNKQAMQSPGQHIKTYIDLQRRLCQKSLKRKIFTPKENTRTDKDCGPEACDPADLDYTDLNTRCKQRLLEYQKSPQEIASIETATIGQLDNALYITHRSERLIANQFGMICRRRSTTPYDNHVMTILNKKNLEKKDIGQQNFTLAKTMYMHQFKKTIRSAGLFIDEEYGFLAASPDGIVVGENAVVEIKSFPALVRQSQTIEMAAKENKGFCIQLENNKLVMNKAHNYYYQVQGQLRITKMHKCYFLCFTAVSNPITVVEVCRDEEFISIMMPKLVSFFKRAILPEIILRELGKSSKCIDFNK